jgi:hypothetical protein
MYSIGDWVCSKPVGRKGSFYGEIIGGHGLQYIVRCSENKKWYRNFDELEPISDPQKMGQSR